MDVYLDPALSSRRTAAGPARDLAAFPAREQGFVLHWGAVIARDNAELAYQFTAFAPRGLRAHGPGRHGVLAAATPWTSTTRRARPPPSAPSRTWRALRPTCRRGWPASPWRTSPRCLERFVCGLNGRALKIRRGRALLTPTPRPSSCPPWSGGCPEKEANFRLYKAMTVHQWAQGWYGTWRGGVLLEALARRGPSAPRAGPLPRPGDGAPGRLPGA